MKKDLWCTLRAPKSMMTNLDEEIWVERGIKLVCTVQVVYDVSWWLSFASIVLHGLGHHVNFSSVINDQVIKEVIQSF